MLAHYILSALGVKSSDELQGPSLSLFTVRMERQAQSSFAPDYVLIWAADEEQAKIIGYYELNGPDPWPGPPYRIAFTKVSRRMPKGFRKSDFTAPAKPRQLRYSEDLKEEGLK